MDRVSDPLCSFVEDLTFDDLPPATIAAAQTCLLDAVGVMTAASGASAEVQPFINMMDFGGTGPCNVLGTGRRTTVSIAALINGAFSHALDFEDTFDRGPGHPNASLIPALIALAQSGERISGWQFLTALVAGCEVSCRISLALKQRMEQGGWYPPPIQAGLGASAGAAKLLGLNARQIRSAISMALCQLSTPGEIKNSHGTTLRAVREAFPAQAAVQSALLARQGVEGFEHPLEGTAGFYAIFAGGEFDSNLLKPTSTDQFLIEDLTYKAWPSCRGTHAFIELAVEAVAARSGKSSTVKDITVTVDDVQMMLCEPFDQKAHPTSSIAAKFSIPFCVGAAIAHGKVDLDSFSGAVLTDPEVCRLATLTKVERGKIAGAGLGCGGGIRLTWADGDIFEAELIDARGAPSRPLQPDQLRAKFLDCLSRGAEPVVSSKATEIFEAFQAVEQREHAAGLFDF